jgi:hypothetical protein
VVFVKRRPEPTGRILEKETLTNPEKLKGDIWGSIGKSGGVDSHGISELMCDH